MVPSPRTCLQLMITAVVTVVAVGACSRAQTKGPVAANSAPNGVRTSYDQWGWVEVEGGGAKYIMVILQDTKRTARIRMSFFLNGKPVRVEKDTFTVNALLPILDTWEMHRDGSSWNTFVGTPSKPDFLICMNAAAYEVSHLRVNGTAIGPLRFGYRFNPYELLPTKESFELFESTARSAGFPAMLQDEFDPLERLGTDSEL